VLSADPPDSFNDINKNYLKTITNAIKLEGFGDCRSSRSVDVETTGGSDGEIVPNINN
jgi:hypothetical protein